MVMSFRLYSDHNYTLSSLDNYRNSLCQMYISSGLAFNVTNRFSMSVVEVIDKNMGIGLLNAVTCG